MEERFSLEPIKQEPKMIQITSKATALLADAIKLEIKDDFTLEYAGLLRAEAKTHVKLAEDLRLKFTGPLNKHVKSINDLFAEAKEPYNEVINTLDDKIIVYDRKVKAEIARIQKEKDEAERERLAELAKLTAANRIIEEAKKEAHVSTKTGLPLPSATPVEVVEEMPKTLAEVSGGLGHIQMRWMFEVIDFKALPDEYKLVDEVKLSRLAIRDKEKATVPGVRFFPEEHVASKRLR
jgi:hypothetical protein